MKLNSCCCSARSNVLTSSAIAWLARHSDYTVAGLVAHSQHDPHSYRALCIGMHLHTQCKACVIPYSSYDVTPNSTAQQASEQPLWLSVCIAARVPLEAVL
eukprot:4603-Heterococcus_DN1.PRE.5